MKGIIFLIIFLISPANANIITCDQNSKDIGVDFIQNKEKITFLSTAEVVYYFDEMESINDAIYEAKDQAVVNIADFLKIKISNSADTDDLAILIKDSINEDNLEHTYSDSDYEFNSESILKGVSLVNYCKIEDQKIIKATVEFSTNSLEQVSKLKSLLNLE